MHDIKNSTQTQSQNYPYLDNPPKHQGTHIMMYEDETRFKTKHIHSLIGFQGCLRRNGPPNTLPIHERIWIPRLLHCIVQTPILCLQHMLNDHPRQHSPTLHLQRHCPKRNAFPLSLYNLHGTAPKMASCRQPRI